MRFNSWGGCSCETVHSSERGSLPLQESQLSLQRQLGRPTVRESIGVKEAVPTGHLKLKSLQALHFGHLNVERKGKAGPGCAQ